MAEILREIAECDFAATGKEAVKAYNRALKNRSPYNLILLDLELPEVSGLQILEKIRSGESRSGIRLGEGVPIIVVTGHQKKFLEAYDKGCDDYILKPINAPLLIAKVSQVLAKTA